MAFLVVPTVLLICLFQDNSALPESRQPGSGDSFATKNPLPVDNLPPTQELIRQRAPVGLSRLPGDSEQNPLSESKVDLGRRLFFDGMLSRDGSVSCASCHQPEHGMASPDPVAIGIGGRRGRRNTPSLFNRGYGSHFFWDGRSADLEHQALLPISDPDEMGADLSSVLDRIRQNEAYQSMFRAAFGETQQDNSLELVTPQHVAKALAAFQRTLVLGDSPVDHFRAARVPDLSLEARQGLWIFESRGRCWQCHSGDNFSDESFHNTGVGFGQADRDLGRFEVTGLSEDRYRFKTPTLRGLVKTAPYMHDGSIATLEEVVEFYNRGGAPQDPELSPLLQPLQLTESEKAHLLAFLRALSEEIEGR